MIISIILHLTWGSWPALHFEYALHFNLKAQTSFGKTLDLGSLLSDLHQIPDTKNSDYSLLLKRHD